MNLALTINAISTTMYPALEHPIVLDLLHPGLIAYGKQ